jgi:pSer/pThr/pTyr-binding forkhead associated (FHA) protein
MAAAGDRPKLWIAGPDGAPRPVVLAEGAVTLGRDPSCEISVPDEAVSSAHLRIETRGPSVVVTDLDSSNGTIVNGERLRAPKRLRNGDVIRFGSHRAELALAPQILDDPTARAGGSEVVLTPDERATARALVAPYLDSGVKAGRPATRKEVAAALQVSERTAQRRLAALAARLGVSGEGERGRALAERILELGLSRE